MSPSAMRQRKTTVNSIPCEIVAVLDRSGSMEACRDSTIEGFNAFLRDQRLVGGEAYVSLYQFDDIYEEVYVGRELLTAPDLTRETFVPRGWTALHDAMGRTLQTMIDNVPSTSRAILAVLTDGGENKSTEHTQASVARLVEEARRRGWQVLFIGANQDAVLTAKKFHIPAESAMTYAANEAGTRAAFSSTARASNAYRMTGQAVSYTADDRAQQVVAGAAPDSWAAVVAEKKDTKDKIKP